MSASIQLAQISLFVFGWFWFKINFREKIWKGLFYLQWKEQQARSEFHLYIICNAFSQTHRRIGEWLVVHNFEPVIQPVSFTAFFLDTSTFLDGPVYLQALFGTSSSSSMWYLQRQTSSLQQCWLNSLLWNTVTVLNTLSKHCFCCQLLLHFWSLILSVVAE